MEFYENARVYTARDDQLGKIDRIVIDPVANEVTHLVVRKGFLLPEDKLVPVEDIATATTERFNLKTSADPDDYAPFEDQNFVELDATRAADVAGTATRRLAASPLAWFGAYGAPFPTELAHTRTVTARNIPERAVALKPGSSLMTRDLEEVGTVDEIITNPDGVATHLIVNHDTAAPERAVPITFVERLSEGGVQLSVDYTTLRALPPFSHEDSNESTSVQVHDGDEPDAATISGRRLQSLLGDIVDLTLQIQHVRWNVADSADGLREQLDDFDALVRAGSDAIAARLRELGIAPDGRVETVYEQLPYPPLGSGPFNRPTAISSFTTRLARIAQRIRQSIEATEGRDRESADVLRSLSEEMLTWTNSFDVRV